MSFLVDGGEELEVLDIFMEECAECIVEASKIIRFSNDGEDLEKEIGDLMCMIALLHEYGLIDQHVIDQHIENKFEKLKTYSNLTKL